MDMNMVRTPMTEEDLFRKTLLAVMPVILEADMYTGEDGAKALRKEALPVAMAYLHGQGHICITCNRFDGCKVPNQIAVETLNAIMDVIERS